MTESEIISYIDNLYCYEMVNNVVLDRINEIFSNLCEITMKDASGENGKELSFLLQEIKAALENGEIAKGVDLIHLFFDVKNKRLVEVMPIDREELIDTFKSNLRVMYKHYRSLFFGVMIRLFYDESAKTLIDTTDIDDIDNILDRYIDKIDLYNGELIDSSFRDYALKLQVDERLLEDCNFYDNRKYYIERNFTGEKIVRIVDNGSNYYHASGYDTKREAESVFKNTKYQFDAAFILWGLGNGNIYNEFFKNTNDDNEILCIEPDVELFFKALHVFNLPKQENKTKGFVFVKGINDEAFDQIFTMLVTPQRAPVITTVFSMIYLRYYQDEFYKVKEKIEQLHKHASMLYNVSVTRGINIVENAIRNFPILIKSSSVINACKALEPIKDRTVFVVGAGPSLDKNVDVLKKVKGKAVIIAADTAVRVMLNHGIVPDMMVTIDSKKRIETFDDDRINDIAMICGAESLYGAVANHRTKIICLSDMEFYLHFLVKYEKKDYLFDTGGSVATSGLFFAMLAGFKKIVLMGLDLAMTDMKFHASDIYNEGEADPVALDLIKCEGYDGNDVYTSSDMLAYGEWIEDLSKKHPDLEIINCTEGGRKLKGIENRTALSESLLLQDLEDVDFNYYIDKAECTYTSKEQQEILSSFKEYGEYSHSENKKLELLLADIKVAIDKLSKNKNIDLSSLFERINDHDESVRDNEYLQLVDIKTKEKQKDKAMEVFKTSESESESDPIKLLQVIYELIDEFRIANLEVGEIFFDTYRNEGI